MRDYFVWVKANQGVGYGEEEEEAIEIKGQVSLVCGGPSGRTSVRPLPFSALVS